MPEALWYQDVVRLRETASREINCDWSQTTDTTVRPSLIHGVLNHITWKGERCPQLHEKGSDYNMFFLVVVFLMCSSWSTRTQTCVWTRYKPNIDRSVRPRRTQTHIMDFSFNLLLSWVRRRSSGLTELSDALSLRGNMRLTQSHTKGFYVNLQMRQSKQ